MNGPTISGSANCCVCRRSTAPMSSAGPCGVFSPGRFQHTCPNAPNPPEFDKVVDGQVGLIDATSNILFRAELFRSRPSPWFDPGYALMGCEDKDLLISFKIENKSFAWASRAYVTEEMPASRCSQKWMLMRARSE